MTRGIVGAARGQENDSANSQFFITLKREQGFDQRYTIFGKVIEGMNNAPNNRRRNSETGRTPARKCRDQKRDDSTKINFVIF